jgi:hypothetical protein
VSEGKAELRLTLVSQFFLSVTAFMNWYMLNSRSVVRGRLDVGYNSRIRDIEGKSGVRAARSRCSTSFLGVVPIAYVYSPNQGWKGLLDTQAMRISAWVVVERFAEPW